MKKSKLKRLHAEALDDLAERDRRIIHLESDLAEQRQVTVDQAERLTTLDRQHDRFCREQRDRTMQALHRLAESVGLRLVPGEENATLETRPGEGTISSSLEIVTVSMMRGFASNAARAISYRPVAGDIEQQVVEGLRTLLTTAVREGHAERIVTDGERA